MRNKYLKISIAVVMLVAAAYAGWGVYDYTKWVETKKAVAAGGYPYQCGASKIINVTPLCKYTQPGVCSCLPCALACDNSYQVDIIPQPVCGVGALVPSVVCINPAVALANAKTMGTPLEFSIGKQAIFAGITNMMQFNGVIATPTLAAGRVEKIVDWFNYAVASFRDK
ncbi:MAG: hypothetical protein Q8O93_04800 [bacterium]|nr:hypothetical protein [bacterium]